MTSNSTPYFNVERLICFGWTGRNEAAREAHIAELAAVGVPRPSRIPIMVELSPWLLTHGSEITVTSNTTSGEVEFVLIVTAQGVMVTVGSDHTDRVIERHSVPASKQMCAKCVAEGTWPLSEVTPHWNDLVLRSWVHDAGRRVLYQEHTVESILSPQALLAEAAPMSSGVTALFCGTIPTIPGIVCGQRYDLELFDPVCRRSLTHGYNVRVLPQLI